MKTAGSGGVNASNQVPIQVSCRIRPALPSESTRCCTTITTDRSGKRVLSLKSPRGGQEPTIFKFDRLYSAASTQEDIFQNEVKPLIDQVMKGINATIFAYGSTGSGKTFTVIGSDAMPGIIPRSVETLLNAAGDNMTADFESTKQTERLQLESMHMSFLEIYNNKAWDLLERKERELSIREEGGNQTYCPELAKIQVESVKQFSDCFQQARASRATAATNLNDQSSRSHAMLILYLRYTDGANIYSAKLNIIDLAGNEDNRKSGNCGARLTESCQINSSLFSLSNVINALNSGSSHVPFRDSKLTRLLSDSLGGKSESRMIACVAPHPKLYNETLNTLSYALKVRNINNTPMQHVSRVSPPPCAAAGSQAEEHVEAARSCSPATSSSFSTVLTTSHTPQHPTREMQLYEWKSAKKRGRDAGEDWGGQRSAKSGGGQQARPTGVADGRCQERGAGSDGSSFLVGACAEFLRGTGVLDEGLQSQLEQVQSSLQARMAPALASSSEAGGAYEPYRGAFRTPLRTRDPNVPARTDWAAQPLQTPTGKMKHAVNLLEAASKVEESDGLEACRLLEQALALLPRQHAGCAATADKIRMKLSAIAGNLGGGPVNEGGAGLLSPEQMPMTPCSLMLHHQHSDDLQFAFSSAMSQADDAFMACGGSSSDLFLSTPFMSPLPAAAPSPRPPPSCDGGCEEASGHAAAGAADDRRDEPSAGPGEGSGGGLVEAANVVVHRQLLECINTWGSSRLQTLKGIGKQRAARIIEMRDEGGGPGRAVRHLGELTRIGMTNKQIEALFLLNAPLSLGLHTLPAQSRT